MNLQVLDGKYGICKLSAGAYIPKWALQGAFFSVTHTPDEISIVCPEANIPSHLEPQGDRRVVKVKGPLDFQLTGILSALLEPLALAQISVFTLSTFETDYLLMKNQDLGRAIEILREAGHEVD